MRVKRLSLVLVLGLGLTLGLLWLLGGGRSSVVRAASLTVTTTADELNNDGDCSLREAIQAANTDTAVDGCAAGSGADTITLPPGTYVLTITGSGEDANQTGDLDITDALTIVGAGPGQTIIDANSIDRVFHIHSTTGTVVISGVTVINGNTTGAGGGIYNGDADLTLINTVVSSNTAIRGGGVYIYRGSVALSGGQIVSNTTVYGGGGVYVYQSGATLSMEDGQIGGNSASDGGGVYINQGSATLNGGQIVSNTATSYHGGGVYINWDSATFTLNGGQILSNTASVYGGGVFIHWNGATLNMSDGQIGSNTAHSGGGVYINQGGATLNMSGGRIVSNTASSSGGGVYVSLGRAVLSGGQVVSNTASSGGGGIHNDGGSLSLVNSTLSGNRASGGPGGGLYNGGTSIITYTTIASNTASSGGDGIHRAGGTVTLLDSIVAYNGPANCNGTITSNGHNLDDGDSCDLTATGDITSTDPLLGPLTDDGGTLVHPLLEGSPAIDAGVCVPGITTDQRGVSRPQGAGCDIGAYEAAVAPTSVAIAGPARGTPGEHYVFTASVAPPTVTLPLICTWSPAPDGGQGTPLVTYTWSAAGSQAISVTVQNTAGSAVGTHTIEIAHRVYLPLVLRH